MQELKPVARINEWHPCNVYFDGEGYPSAYEVIPDTHRIVPVELLEELVDITLTHSWYETAEELRAIIDNKENT